jgi:hypothetical protein
VCPKQSPASKITVLQSCAAEHRASWNPKHYAWCELRHDLALAVCFSCSHHNVTTEESCIDGAGSKINRELESQQQPSNRTRSKSSSNKPASEQEAKCELAAQGAGHTATRNPALDKNRTEPNNDKQHTSRTKTPFYTNEARRCTRVPTADPPGRQAARPGSSRNPCVRCGSPLQR